jgi:hypothetical protein
VKSEKLRNRLPSSSCGLRRDRFGDGIFIDPAKVLAGLTNSEFCNKRTGINVKDYSKVFVTFAAISPLKQQSWCALSFENGRATF